MKINELYESDYDYFDDINEKIHDIRDMVWYAFLNNKSIPFKPVKKNVIKTVWQQLGRDGFVRNEKLVDKITERFIHNVLVLQATTEFMGHESYSLVDEYPELEDDETMEKLVDWIDNNISDYGLKPLWGYVNDLYNTNDAEEKVVILDKMLQVTHPRNDLANHFIEGGSQSLTELFQLQSLYETLS